MPSGKRAIERRVAELGALRTSEDRVAAIEQLGKALGDRQGYVVARAASVASDLGATELVPLLIRAFERLLDDGARTDPQCLAKLALVKALETLGSRAPDVYVRGVGYVQWEPAWGGRTDTAGALRGACAVALTSAALPDLEVLQLLGDALADPIAEVRLEAARAIEQMNREEGALLLWLKALVGDVEPGVQGQCFTSYLSLAPSGAVSFVARFLQSESEDVQLEAASALAQCRSVEAIAVLDGYWEERRLPVELQRALLVSLGASPLREAAEILLRVVAHDRIELAATAMAAIAKGRYAADLWDALSAEIGKRDSERLTAELAQYPPPTPIR
jgi:HEAT repeat protein